MADNNKAKTSAAWSTKDETTLIETLVKQKLAGNWGDNNPKKAAWMACEAALAGTGKPGVVPKNINAIKNRWQRVSHTFFEYMRISHVLFSLKRNTTSSKGWRNSLGGPGTPLPGFPM
jgi:hypothetical protein